MGAFVRVGFTVKGEQQISRGFEHFAAQVGSLAEPLDEMADVILAAVRAQFDTQGTSGLGVPWTPLSAAYKQWKDQHFPGRPILVRTGGMKGALLNKKHAVRVTDTSMVYEPRGKGGEVAGYHQTGHPAGVNHGPLPQRKIVALTTAQKRQAVDRVFSEWLHREKVKAGLSGPGSG